MRIAAVGDLHVREGDEERVRELFRDVKERADVLVLAGDLTDHGRPVEAEALLRGLHGVGVPVVAVLGNHDHENGRPQDVVRLLRSSGLHVLDRESVVIDGVGFVGAKGFGGGFGERLVRGFGEDMLKRFVSESVAEAEGLRVHLKRMEATAKVALLHYAPVEETVRGEPPEIHPFLGTSRLAQSVDEGGATLCVHGHAHHGSLRGRTPGGVPVWNVSLPVLRAAGKSDPYLVLEA